MTPAPAPTPIPSFLEGRLRAGDLPGAVWWVEEEGSGCSAGVLGHAALEPERESARLETPYDLASLTKPLATALLAVLLEEEGKLDLEAPVSRYVEEMRGTPYGDATVLDLGAHRVGLPAWRPLYLSARGLEGFLGTVAAEPPQAPRGATLYSDLGYLVLGAAVERAGGDRLDRLFESRIASPLGLSSTGFAGAGRRFAGAAPTERESAYERRLAGEEGRAHAWRQRIARGEVHDGNAHALGGVAGHAGLFGTAAGVAAIGREILSPKVLALGPSARRRLLSAVEGEGSRTFGFVTARDSAAARGVLPDDAPGHVGFTGTSLWLDPARGRILVLLSNRVHPEVRETDFQAVRLGFHRAALAELGG